MLNRILFIFILVIPCQVGCTQENENAYSSDTESVESTIRTLYDVISGTKEEQRDWDRFRHLFIKNARLIGSAYTREGEFDYRNMTPDEYINANSPFFERQDFFENELSRTTNEYDHIVQVFSTYELKFFKEGQTAARGINSIQLINARGRWWIVSLMWEQEAKQHPIPEKYLN